MKNFFNRFMKKYEKSRLFRIVYSVLTFVIGVNIAALAYNQHWFIRGLLGGCAGGMILYPFFTLKEERKN